MITRTFKLCLNAGTGSAPYINVSQYDEGETWLFELYSETGERYIPTTGAIVGVKSDGHGIANTGTVDSEGRVVIAETQQMTASAGRAIYELSIDGLTHGTANFIVAVERKPTDDAVMSDSDLSLIQEAIDSAEVIVEVIGDGDPSEVIGEHVDAWLDNHPEATTTVEDGAITAPKINNSLWDKLLVSEEASGNPASFDDGADDVPVSSLKVALEPIQLGSGDPSPSNVRPIIASNGKNTLAPWVTSQTLDGVTWTASNDGTFTTSGTASASSQPFSNNFTLPVGSYVLSGCPSGGSSSTYFLRLLVYNASNTLVANYSDYGSGVSFTLDATADHLRIFASVNSGKTAPSGTWKPMIRLASITDPSYQPYQGIAVQQNGKNLFNDRFADYSKPDNYCIFPVKLEQGKTYTIKATKTGNTVSGNLVGIVRAGDRYSNFVGLLSAVNTDGVANKYQLSIDNTWTDPKLVAYANETEWNNIFANYQIQLEEGEATAYEPYTSASYPYSLGQPVYGGTVDLATGVLTVDRVMLDLGTLTWTKGTGNLFFATGGTNPTTIGLLENSRTTTGSPNGIMSAYRRSTTTSLNAFNSDNGSFIQNANWISATQNAIGISDSGYASSTADQFKTAMSGMQFVGKLQTPQTIQLTPQEVKTLLGYNNISSTGTVDVIYHADTKLYVDKMTNVDNNIIAPTEEGFTATRNYTVNDLVIVNDTLYKVTANIANGGTITPNSNVTATTLSTLIKALS